MDLLNPLHAFIVGVMAIAPSSPFSQRSDLCYEARGMVRGDGSDLAPYGIQGCIAMVMDGQTRCASDGNYLRMYNARSAPIIWTSATVSIREATLDPNTERLFLLPTAESGKDTPSVEVDVIYCK